MSGNLPVPEGRFAETPPVGPKFEKKKRISPVSYGFKALGLGFVFRPSFTYRRKDGEFSGSPPARSRSLAREWKKMPTPIDRFVTFAAVIAW